MLSTDGLVHNSPFRALLSPVSPNSYSIFTEEHPLRILSKFLTRSRASRHKAGFGPPNSPPAADQTVEGRPFGDTPFAKTGTSEIPQRSL